MLEITNFILLKFFLCSLSTLNLNTLYSLLSNRYIFLTLNSKIFLTNAPPIEPAPPVTKIFLFIKILLIFL